MHLAQQVDRYQTPTRSIYERRHCTNTSAFIILSIRSTTPQNSFCKLHRFFLNSYADYFYVSSSLFSIRYVLSLEDPIVLLSFWFALMRTQIIGRVLTHMRKSPQLNQTNWKRFDTIDNRHNNILFFIHLINQVQLATVHSNSNHNDRTKTETPP